MAYTAIFYGSAAYPNQCNKYPCHGVRVDVVHPNGARGARGAAKFGYNVERPRTHYSGFLPHDNTATRFKRS